MRNSFLLLLISFNFCHADYLLNTAYICIKSYYYTPSTGTLYYTRSDTGAVVSSTTKSLEDDIIDGFEYNSTSARCQKVASNNSLNLENNDYTYFMSLTGLVSGLLLAFFALLALKIAL